MKYNKKLLKRLIGKSISSIVLHHYTAEDFESLDWITFTIEGKHYTFSTGKFAEDITIEPNYSLPQIEKWLKDLYEGFENEPWVVSKDFDYTQIKDAKIKRVILIERFNFEYAHRGYILLDNGKVIQLSGGVDCLHIEIQNSYIEIE